MSYITQNWYWIAAALGSGGALLWLQLQSGGGGGDLGAQEAVLLINREKATVIDVSDAADFAAAHVRNARNLPLDTLAEGVKGLPANKQLPIVVVDATGARASKAVAKLKALGYDKAQGLRGGLKAWREANLPIDKAD
ncbi:MAG TPA: rhodanese-like domain-containing protein [Candidatus Aquabacterium excrementipullorum]|nr:rhodanese-like domain-containing protein [Candidatus Aquabacterium excrementipullorum]